MVSVRTVQFADLKAIADPTSKSGLLELGVLELVLSRGFRPASWRCGLDLDGSSRRLRECGEQYGTEPRIALDTVRRLTVLAVVGT